MSLSKDDLIEIMTKAKDLGLTELKVDGIDIRMGPQSVMPPVVEVLPAKALMTEAEIASLVKALNPLDDLTDDEILFYATPYYDELQERKKLQQEAAKTTAEVANG